MAAYQEAALRLQRALGEAKTPAQRKRYLSQVEAILGQLDEITAGYLGDELPQQFRDGSDEAIAQLRKVRGLVVDDTFTQIHTQALQELVDDATLKFATALEGVRASAKSAIKKATKQEIVNKLVQAEIEGASRPSVGTRKTLEEAGIVAIQSANRGWNLEDYASMLTHTILADAHNTGAMTRYLSNGIEYGEVIERGDAPDSTCRFMRGKIVWLGDRRLIPPFHPNCFGGIKPFLGTPKGPIRSPEDARIPADVKKMLLKNS